MRIWGQNVCNYNDNCTNNFFCHYILHTFFPLLISTGKWADRVFDGEAWSLLVRNNSSISYTVNMSLSLCLATDQPCETYPWQPRKCAAGCRRSRFDRSFELLPLPVRCSAASWTGSEALEEHKHTQSACSFMLRVTQSKPNVKHTVQTHKWLAIKNCIQKHL